MRCIIWLISFNQFVDMRLNVSAFVGIRRTCKLILINCIRRVHESLFRLFNICSIFGLILSHFQLRNFYRRCITRNHAFFNIFTINVRYFDDFTADNITRFIIRRLNQLIRCNRNRTTFGSNFRLSRTLNVFRCSRVVSSTWLIRNDLFST